MSCTDDDISTDPSDYSDLETSASSDISSISIADKQHNVLPISNHNNEYPSIQQAIITDLCATNSITPNANHKIQTNSRQKANLIKFEPDIDSTHAKQNNLTTIDIKKEYEMCRLSEFETSDESDSESFYSSYSAFSDCVQFNDDDDDPTEPVPTVLKVEPTSNNTYSIKKEPNIKLEIKASNRVKYESKRIKYERKKKVECTSCNDCFSSHFQYRNHMKDIHGVNRAYKCLKCGKYYSNKSGLTAHDERDHEMLRDYKCTHCPKAFYRKATLERHQRVHDGKKPFKCSHCKLRCSQKSSLRQHIIAVHLKQRNYKCKYCDKAFAASTTMKSHMVALHNDDKYARFKCNKCHKKFYERATYTKHCDKHTMKAHPIRQMIKNGHCPYIECNKKYTSKNKAASVKYHLVTKHKDRRYANYQCKICDKLFYDKTNYTQHCDAKH